MYRSKLITILKTITNKELKKFGEYIVSPFHNKNDKVIKLFNELHPFAPHYEEEAVMRTDIFPKIFEKEAFNDKKLKHVMTDLTKLLESFLSYQQYQESAGGFYKNFFLLKAYVDKDLDKYFGQVRKAQQTSLEKSPIRDSNYYFFQYLLDAEKYLFSTIKNNHISNEVRNDLLKSLTNNLDVFYVSNKLKYICEMYNTSNVLSSNLLKPALYDEIIAYVKSGAEKVPSITIYYQVLMTLVERENEAHYNEFIAYLSVHTKYFSESELYDMYTFGQNYCVKRYNGGDTSYARKLYELYKISIDTKILFQKNMLSEWDYKNVITTALLAEELDFAEKAIYEYRKYVNSEKRQNVFTYSLANLHFAKKNYDEAIQSMQEVEFNDPYYHMDTKVLLIKCYYELNELTPLLYTVDALKIFITRNKHIAKSNKRIYLTNVKFLRKLANVRANRKRTRDKAIEKLKQELHESQVIITKWLEEKIEELEKNAKKYTW